MEIILYYKCSVIFKIGEYFNKFQVVKFEAFVRESFA